MGLRGAIGFSFYHQKGGGIFRWLLRLLARAIRYFTKSRWSHSFVIFLDDDVVGPYVIEAEELGVTIDSYQKYLDPMVYNFELWMLKASEMDINKGILHVAKLNGKSYGYLQLLGFVIIWAIRKLTGKEAHNPITGGIVCSELVLEYVRAVGIEKEKFAKLYYYNTSPETLYKIISRSDKFYKIPIERM